jgi:hypothetical protein
MSFDVALCPTHVRDKKTGTWNEADTVKVYRVKESVVKKVVAG